jgi:hypothetical protein
MKNIILNITLFVIGFFIAYNIHSVKPIRFPVVKIDTLFVPKEIVKPSVPVITYVYLPDTNLRKSIIDTTVVVEIEKNKTKLEVTTIDTKSVVKTEEYKLPKIWYTYTVSADGDVKIKRKWLPRVIAGAVLIGTTIFIIKKLKDNEL